MHSNDVASRPVAVERTRREQRAIERMHREYGPRRTRGSYVRADLTSFVVRPEARERPRRSARRPEVDATAAGTLRFRRSMTRVWAASALVLSGGFAVATTLPAQAVPVQASAERTAAAVFGGQEVDGIGGETAAIARDDYAVLDTADLYEHRADTFVNDAGAAIQWPFLVGVPVTSGFGARNVAGCSACSTFHEGADFAPGDGTPIRSVAAGTVIKVQADDGGYGNDVWVQHDVDGLRFVSVYGHMRDNSFKVSEGQAIAVGTELGLVGNTGVSTGAHLHLEIHIDDEPVDPIAWLREHAG